MLNLTNVKNVLFGDGVLEDIHNVDRFLGVSTAGYHFSRLTCRKTLDAVAGTAKAAQYAAWYATDGAIDLAAPLAAEYAEAMMIPEAWANLKSSVAYTNRGVANCLRLSWTVVGPPLRYALPFLDFVWDGLEPPLVKAKDAVVDAADDAMYTFKESFNEAMGPTVDEWGRGVGANRSRPRQRVWRLFDVRVAPGRVLLHVPRALRRPSARDTPHPSAFVAAMGRAVQEDAVGRVDDVLRAVRLRVPPAGEPLREAAGDPLRGAGDRRMRRGLRQRRRARLRRALQG